MELARFRKHLPWLVLLFGLTCTYALREWSLQSAKKDLIAQFEQQAHELIRQMEQRLETHMLLMRSAAGLFSHDNDVTSREFHNFVASLKIQKTSPGIRGLGFAVIFDTTQRESHNRNLRKKLGKAYTVWPHSRQELGAAIIYLTPPSTRTDGMVGFDMYTDPARRSAMDLARDLNRSAITGKIRLRPQTSDEVQTGFQMYFPVYRRGASIATLSERRQNIAGWVFSPVNADEYLADIAENYGHGLHLSVYSSRETTPDTLLASVGGSALQANNHFEALAFSKTFDIAGHPWTVNVRTTPSFNKHIDTTPAEIIQASGLLISVLLFLYAWVLSHARERAEAVALDMTRDLRDNEYRWQFAVEGQGDGMWDWNRLENVVFYSARWKTMLGYDEGAIGNSLDEWKNRVHPDDWPHVEAVLQPFVQGKSPTFLCEHRLRCKDGSWKWVLGRGMVVSSASDGHALRAIGTSTDISQRKAAESGVLRMTQLYSALSHANQAIIRCKNEVELFPEICNILVRITGFRQAWIGMVEHSDGTIRTAGTAGMSTEYLKAIRISVNQDEAIGQNPAATSLRNDRPVWCQDILDDPGMSSWRHRAIEGGWRAVATLPLHRMRVPVGVLAVYAGEPHVFNEDTRNLLREIAQDVSSAMDNYLREADRDRTEIALRESEIRYSTLFRDNSVVMLLIDPSSGRIVNANQQASTFYGWNIDVLCAMNIRDINTLPHELITPELLLALKDEKKHFYFQHRHADGSVRDVEVFSGPVRIENQTLILSSVHDISERRHTEQALRKSETLNTTILNSLNEHIVLLDTDGVIVTVNEAWLQFARANSAAGYAAEWIGLNYLDHCAAALGGRDDSNAAHAATGIRSVLSGESEYFDMEYPCHSTNEHRWFTMRATRLQDVRSGVIVAHEDITRRKLSEIEIQSSHTRMEELSVELLEAQENERKNLSRELHDELGQKFTTLKLALHKMRGMPDSEQAEPLWQAINEEIASLIERVRSMSGALRPPTLDHLGLEASVRQLLQTHFASTDIAYVLEYAGLPKKLPGQIEITIYRIIQEAVTNIVRHASATSVIIEINGGDDADELELIIRDNGKGFDTSALESLPQNRISYGLTGMGERVKLLGGALNLESVTGKGTRITVLLPLRR